MHAISDQAKFSERSLYNSYLLIFLVSFLVYLLTQREILLSNGREWTALCLSQGEKLLLAALLVVFFAWVRKWRGLRLLLATGLAANLLFLVADRVPQGAE